MTPGIETEMSTTTLTLPERPAATRVQTGIKRPVFPCDTLPRATGRSSDFLRNACTCSQRINSQDCDKNSQVIHIFTRHTVVSLLESGHYQISCNHCVVCPQWSVMARYPQETENLRCNEKNTETWTVTQQDNKREDRRIEKS